MTTQVIHEALHAFLSSIEVLSRYFRFQHFTPIAHDPKVPNFADAVEYAEQGGSVVRTFPGTEFRNKDGIYVAQVAHGRLTMYRIRK